MDINLTVKMDKDIVERAKIYASKQNKSLSQIIESYLTILTQRTQKTKPKSISPFVKSMSKGKSLPIGIDLKKEIVAYREAKHE